MTPPQRRRFLPTAMVVLLLPLFLAPVARADGWSLAIGLPPGLAATAPPFPVVDPLGNFLLLIPTASGLKVAEFASDGSLQPAVSMPASAQANPQPTSVVDMKFLPSGDSVLLLNGSLGPSHFPTSFVAYRFADGHFAGPPVSLAGVVYSFLAVRPGEALVSYTGAVRTIAFGSDGVLVPGALTTLVAFGNGAFGITAIALDPDGTAVALINVGKQIQQAVRSPAGTWSATSVLYDPAGGNAITTSGMFPASTASGRMAAAFTRESDTAREFLVITREPGGLPSAPVPFVSSVLMAGQNFANTEGIRCFRGDDGSLGVVANLEVCNGSDYATASYSAGVFQAADSIVPGGVTTLPGDEWSNGHQNVVVPFTSYGPGAVGVRGKRIVVLQTTHVLSGINFCQGGQFTSETVALQAVNGEAGVDLAAFPLAQWNNPISTGSFYRIDAPYDIRAAIDDQGNAVAGAVEGHADGTPDRMVYFTFGVPGAQHGHAPESTPTPTSTPSPAPTATPGGDDTAVRKCRAAIVGSAAALVQAEAKAEGACAAKIVSGKLPHGTTCRTEAKTAAVIGKARAKLTTAVAKACGGKDKTCGSGSDDVPLAATGWAIGSCPAFRGNACTNAITDCAGISTCVTCIGEAALDEAIGLYNAALTPTDPKNKAEKVLNKCQATIGRAATTFLGAKSKALAKCWQTVNAGKATGDMSRRRRQGSGRDREGRGEEGRRHLQGMRRRRQAVRRG